MKINKSRIRKKVLILGASSDIGVEVCKLLIKDNYSIVAHYYKNKKKLEKINYKYIKILQIDFDKINLKKLKINDIDIVINLVGYIDNKSYEKTNLSTMYKSIKINSLIPQLIIQKCVINMLKKNWGRILNCSSIGVKFGGGINSYNYSLSKYCSEFIPNSHKKWVKKNVNINNLRIGITDTKIHKKMGRRNKFLKERIQQVPINRMATPKEISRYIAYLISEDNSFMTGATINVSGGE